MKKYVPILSIFLCMCTENTQKTTPAIQSKAPDTITHRIDTVREAAPLRNDRVLVKKDRRQRFDDSTLITYFLVDTLYKTDTLRDSNTTYVKYDFAELTIKTCRDSARHDTLCERLSVRKDKLEKGYLVHYENNDSIPESFGFYMTKQKIKWRHTWKVVIILKPVRADLTMEKSDRESFRKIMYMMYKHSAQPG